MFIPDLPAGLAVVRGEIEEAWGATVVDSFGMSDVWSTMAGECGRGEGLHLTTRDYAVLELVDRLGATVSPAEWALMREHVVMTSRYEWMFWDMGWRCERWPFE